MGSHLRARLPVTAIVLLAGLTTTPPAALLNGGATRPPITKWLPGEQKPTVATPKAGRTAVATSPSLEAWGRMTTGTAPLLYVPSSPTTGSMAASTTPAVAPTVHVSSRVEPNGSVHLGETINLYVELSWEGNAGDVVPEAPEEPTLMNLTKRGMVQTSRILPQAAVQTVVMTYHYVLEPNAEGAAAIEPIEIPYRLRGGDDRLRFTSDRFALTILPRRWPWGTIVLGTVGTLGVIGAGTLTTTALVARARRKREAARVPPPPTPFEQLASELEATRRLVKEGASKDAYDGVERLVRKALGLRLGGDFRHTTISELSERLAGEEMDPTARDRAASILDRCAQVKFAGYVPTVADQEQIVADCQAFLHNVENEGQR